MQNTFAVCENGALLYSTHITNTNPTPHLHLDRDFPLYLTDSLEACEKLTPYKTVYSSYKSE